MDIHDDNLRYYFAVKQLPRVGNTTIISHLNKTGSVYDTFNDLSKRVDGFNKSETFHRVDTLLSLVQEYACDVVTWEDRVYPTVLRELSDAPVYFFKRGEFEPNDFQGIAIVGTRNFTSYGKMVTELIVKELAMYNVPIISGFMRGIDTVAHVSALNNNMRTIAVLGSGFQFPVPPDNKNLIPRVAQKGVIMSEFDIDQIPQKYTFPLRNRIVSCLSKATIVIEAGEKSGALITARYAGEQGREVYAVPGSILSKSSAGTNWLIENGATPIISVSSLMEHLGFGGKKSVKVPDQQFETHLQKQIFSRINHEHMHVDDLVREFGVDTATVLQELSIMEIRGMVVRGKGDVYMGVVSNY